MFSWIFARCKITTSRHSPFDYSHPDLISTVLLILQAKPWLHYETIKLGLVCSVKCNEHYIYFLGLTIVDRPLLISLFSSVDLKNYTILKHSYFNLSTFYFLLKTVRPASVHSAWILDYIQKRSFLNCWQSLGKWHESFCRTVADTELCFE